MATRFRQQCDTFCTAAADGFALVNRHHAERFDRKVSVIDSVSPALFYYY
jgi:hypothetical protein